MREIKFRVWDNENNQMDYDYLIDYLPGPVSLNGYLEENFKPNNILMQSTSQKDKNGVEIWEGDIIKQTYMIGMESESTRLGEVYWCDAEAGFGIAWGDSCSQFSSFQWPFYSVVANIYESPECKIIKENN